MTVEQPGSHRHAESLARLEAFSDGIFAIAITLLVLELRVPALDDRHDRALLRALGHEWPSYVSFTLSFTTIFIMWVHHHGLFRMVHHADSPFMFANCLLLLLVTAVPFPTSLVARYLDSGAGQVAAAAYAALFVAIALAFNLLWWTASHRRRLLVAAVTEGQRRSVTRRFLVGPPIYLLGVGLALWNGYLGMLVCGGLWAFWLAMAWDRPRRAYAGPHVEASHPPR